MREWEHSKKVESNFFTLKCVNVRHFQKIWLQGDKEMEKELNEVLEALGKVLSDQKNTIALQRYQIESLQQRIEELEKKHGELW